MRMGANRMTAPKYRIDWTTIPKEDQKQFLDILKIEVYRAIWDIGDKIWRDIQDARRGEGDQKDTEGTGRTDTGESTGVRPPEPHCANPAGVWGHDQHGNALCESVCPAFGYCKVPHTTLNSCSPVRIPPARAPETEGTGHNPED
jgi:hypothetical protein